MMNMKSTTGSPTSYIDGVRTLPLSILKDLFVFLNKVNFNRMKSATKFLCVETSSGNVVVQPFPVHTYWREK